MPLEEVATAVVEILAGLKLRAEDCALRREIDLLLAAPARFYDEHAHWPSSLADSVPIELSLAIDERGRASFRFTGDLADHRRPLAANLPHYVESARHLTGAAVPTLREVFGSHIDPRGYRAGTAAYHGAGYGRGGARRSTIYFAIGWFPAARFEARFAREVAALDADFLKVGGRRPRRYHGVSYDFDAGVPHRKKFYGWVDLGASGSPANLLGQRRDLTAAGALLTRLLAKGPPADPERALMLHSSVTGTPARCRQKAFFQCNEWSLDAPRAFLDLVLDVSSFCDIDLSPLTVVFDVLTGRGLQLLPTWFAIGADGATFYFAPVEFDSRPNPAAIAREASSRAAAYLMQARAPDGSWPTSEGVSSEEVTAVAAAALAWIPDLRDPLAPTTAWLKRRAEGIGLPTREAAANALIALRRLGCTTRETATRLRPVEKGDPARTIALVLVARLASGLDGAASIDASLKALYDQEPWWGGFGADHDVEGMERVVEAVGEASARRSSEAARGARASLTRAREWLWGVPLPPKPISLAAWLAGRAFCGSPPDSRAARRVLGRLNDLQRSNGSWSETDASALFTTATVLRSLASYREAVSR